MSLIYHRFRPIRPAEQYLGRPGHEVGNIALPAYALELIGEARTAGRRPSGVWVDGEYERLSDGVRFLSIRIDPTPESGRPRDPRLFAPDEAEVTA